MPRDSLKRARRFGWLHLAVRTTMGHRRVEKPRARPMAYDLRSESMTKIRVFRSVRAPKAQRDTAG